MTIKQGDLVRFRVDIQLPSRRTIKIGEYGAIECTGQFWDFLVRISGGCILGVDKEEIEVLHFVKMRSKTYDKVRFK